MPDVSWAPRADVAIIGAGASGTAVLLRLLAEPTAQQTIAVIDRDGEFGTGVPYGSRSAPDSLLISALRDFLPAGQWAEDFAHWLAACGPSLLAAPQDWGIDAAWARAHADRLAGSVDLADLFIPRRLFGRFLRETLLERLARSRHRVLLIRADVRRIGPQQPRGGGPRNLELAPAPGAQPTVHWLPAVPDIIGLARPAVLSAARTVVAIGNPTHRELPPIPAHAHAVPRLHAPGAEAALADLEQRLARQPPARRTTLVVGGNADALEFIHLSRAMRRRLGAPVRVLAPRGRPAHWVADAPPAAGQAHGAGALEALASAGADLSAAALLRAIEADVARADAAGRHQAAVRELSGLLAVLVSELGRVERDQMAAGIGAEISRLLLAAGGDGLDTVLADIAAGRLEFETGRFGAESARALDPDVGAVVNATGFTTVGDAARREPLLRSLLESGVRAAPGDRGLQMDDRQLLAPGLWQLGPLTAGHSGPTRLIWHAESVRRIVGQADIVARELGAVAMAGGVPWTA